MGIYPYLYKSQYLFFKRSLLLFLLFIVVQTTHNLDMFRLKENSGLFKSLTDEQKFIFIMTNENGKVIAELAKCIFNAMKVRENARQNAEII